MNIIFFGTSNFAAETLELISGKCSILATVTQPDRKKGRSLKVSAPPVKMEAAKLGMDVLQPADINDAQFLRKLETLKADAFIVVSFGVMLSKSLLNASKFGALNIHPSLLPKYRGAAPIQQAILAGERKTGVTIIKMNERLDAGDIILQKEVKIEEDDTACTLSDKLAPMGANLVLETLKLLEIGAAEFKKQNEREATMAPKLKKEDGLINWDLPTADILRKIRALEPWPGTYSRFDGRVLKIVKAEVAKSGDFSKFSPGEIVLADQKIGFIVKTKDGAVSILEVQIEGKKPMSAELFLRGHKITLGAKLG